MLEGSTNRNIFVDPGINQPNLWSTRLQFMLSLDLQEGASTLLIITYYFPVILGITSG